MCGCNTLHNSTKFEMWHGIMYQQASCENDVSTQWKQSVYVTRNTKDCSWCRNRKWYTFICPILPERLEIFIFRFTGTFTKWGNYNKNTSEMSYIKKGERNSGQVISACTQIVLILNNFCTFSSIEFIRFMQKWLAQIVSHFISSLEIIKILFLTPHPAAQFWIKKCSCKSKNLASLYSTPDTFYLKSMHSSKRLAGTLY